MLSFSGCPGSPGLLHHPGEEPARVQHEQEYHHD